MIPVTQVRKHEHGGDGWPTPNALNATAFYTSRW